MNQKRKYSEVGVEREMKFEETGGRGGEPKGEKGRREGQHQ